MKIFLITSLSITIILILLGKYNKAISNDLNIDSYWESRSDKIDQYIFFSILPITNYLILLYALMMIFNKFLIKK